MKVWRAKQLNMSVVCASLLLLPKQEEIEHGVLLQRASRYIFEIYLYLLEVPTASYYPYLTSVVYIY